MLTIKTPDEVAKELADRLRSLRLENNWSREELARRSGVTLASLRRFETTGKISLDRLLTLAFVLHKLDGFSQLLKPSTVKSIAELEKRSHTRKRGRNKGK